MTTMAAHAHELPEGWEYIQTDPKYTDLGNAERLVERYGDKLRYVPQWEWLVWDGKRWQVDETGKVMEFAKDTVRNLRVEAATTTDRRRSDELWKHASRSEARTRLRAMVDLACTDPKVVRSVDAFDKDPWLFNCQNGTLDLHTGELRPHSQNDHITMLAPVDYDPEARSADWEQFLCEVFTGNQDLVAYLRRAIGYSLTGSIREPAFFIPWGEGRNGKSTLFRAVTRVMGDYAKDTPVQTFLRKQFSSGATNDQAALPGRRLITASEPETNQTLDLSLVKRITGGDPITACFKYKEYFTFTPQGKVWMATNNKPNIPENTTAVWARIKLIPFTENFYGREDPTVDRRLEAAAKAILAWAVEGCKEWQAHGLQDPDVVKLATRTYQAEQDDLGEFFQERCVFEADQQEKQEKQAQYTVQSSRLYNEYKEWARENGVPPIPSKLFSPHVVSLPGKHIRKGLIRGRMMLQGIGLLSDMQEPGPSCQPQTGWAARATNNSTYEVPDDDIPF